MITEEQKKQIELENKSIAENLRSIKHKILVFSGKGGVGKTTVSVNLAFGLQIRGHKAGLLDADVTGPNVPKMLGLNSDLQIMGGRIIPIVKNDVGVVSVANAITPDQPVIWRGPMRSKLLHQFLANVDWGILDYLVADLPPGTGDEVITLAQKTQPDLAVIVTTPQEVSLVDSRRAINMARKMNIPRIGVVENMSGLICPGCGTRIDLFGIGGGKRQAEQMNVMFLGTIPIDIRAREEADRGKPIILEDIESGVSTAILEIVGNIEKM